MGEQTFKIKDLLNDNLERHAMIGILRKGMHSLLVGQ